MIPTTVVFTSCPFRVCVLTASVHMPCANTAAYRPGLSRCISSRCLLSTIDRAWRPRRCNIPATSTQPHPRVIHTLLNTDHRPPGRRLMYFVFRNCHVLVYSTFHFFAVNSLLRFFYGTLDWAFCACLIPKPIRLLHTQVLSWLLLFIGFFIVYISVNYDGKVSSAVHIRATLFMLCFFLWSRIP